MSGIIQMLVGSVVQKVTDAFFNYVTLLLPGNGTNGAQNNTFLDGSTNNFTITRNGNTTQGTFSPFSQTGWSNYFDGSGDYFTLATNTALDMGTGDFTVEMWVYSTDASADTQNRRFFATDVNGTASIQIGHVTTTTGVAQYCDNGTLGVLITGTTNILNQWAHIAVVRSSSTVTLYVNGVSEGTPATDTGNKGSANFTIGKYPGASGHMKGNISNLRMVKGTAVYTGNFTPPTAPLTAISGTSLLTCQSNRFIDNSSNAFAITRNGDVSVQAFSPFNPTAAWSAATNGGSGYFDGSGDYLSVPASSAFDFGSGAFTLEAWVYLSTVANNASVLLPSSYSGGNGDWILRVGSGGLAGKWEFTTWWGGTGYTASSNDNAVAGTWTHLAAVRNGNTFTLYVNGVAQTTTATNTNTVGFSARTTLICGDNSSGVLLTGYVSSARIVKGTAVYTAGFTPPTSPLTAITNTSLLLNFTNAGIYDATAKNDLETVGNAQISTAQSKFGGSSMYFDGTGDYLKSNAATSNLYAFGTGDFTIEFWVWYSSLPASNYCFIDFSQSVTGAYPAIYITSAGTLIYFANGGNQIQGTLSGTSTWHHIAVSRSGTSTKLFANGTQIGSTYTDSTNYSCFAGRPYVGAFGDATFPLNGYINDLRITKGVARYTSAFTPPTAAFPVQ